MQAAAAGIIAAVLAALYISHVRRPTTPQDHPTGSGSSTTTPARQSLGQAVTELLTPAGPVPQVPPSMELPKLHSSQTLGLPWHLGSIQAGLYRGL
jgi:hypothetical protein